MNSTPTEVKEDPLSLPIGKCWSVDLEPEGEESGEMSFKENKSFGGKQFQCVICTKVFSHERDLKTHCLIHSQELSVHRLLTGEQLFTCSTCGKDLRNLHNLKSHEKIHSGKNFQCEFCKKTFRNKWSLKLHYRIHTGERPYVCSPCGKGYYSQQALKEHKKKQYCVRLQQGILSLRGTK